MTAYLTPVPVLRFFDEDGLPLAGGKLYSYEAGTTTPLATYTDSTGNVANANPVILDANGECKIWLGSTKSYKLNLTDSNDVQQDNWPVDGITSVEKLIADSGSSVLASLADATSTSNGDALIAVKQPFTGTTARTQHSKNIELISVKDFGAVGDGTTNDNDAFVSAIASAYANGHGLFFPAGTYRGWMYLRGNGIVIRGAGSECTTIKLPDGALHTQTIDAGPATVTGVPNVIDCGNLAAGNFATAYTGFDISGLTIDGNRSATSAPPSDLCGWGIGLTKASKANIYDVKIKNCWQGGLGNFIDSNYNNIDVYIENCCNTTQRATAFDVNSSKYSKFSGIISGCLDGLRILDNCYGLQCKFSVYNATYNGLIMGNQLVNIGVTSSDVSVAIYGGCSTNSAQIGAKVRGCNISITQDGTTQGVNVVKQVSSDNNPNCNNITVSSMNGQGYALLLGGDYNNVRLTSRLDGRGGAQGSSYALDVTGSRNVITATVEDSSTWQIRGIAMRSGATSNRVAAYTWINTADPYSEAGTNNAVYMEPTWTSLSLNAGWSNPLGSPYPAPAYAKCGDTVFVRGTVTGGTGTIATLPVNYRPAKNVLFATNANGSLGRAQVATDGTITLQAGTPTNVDLTISFLVY